MSDVEQLLHEIGELYEIIVNIAMRARDHEEAMTATQRIALIEITNLGPLRVRDIAERLAATRATATRAVDALEELGYASRGAVAEDARGVVVSATARGRKWVERREALVRAELEQLPRASVPQRLVDDLASLNRALRTQMNGQRAQAARLIAH